MKEKMRAFMTGRYGMDSLGQFLSRLSLALLVTAILLRQSGAARALSVMACILLVVCYFRIFSRNTNARVRENYAFYMVRQNTVGRIKAAFGRLRDHNSHCFFKCPSCGQMVRVPKGRGLIDITCPKCRCEFREKS